MENRKLKKKTEKQKTSKFKCNEVSVLIIWVSVSVSVLEMVPQMLFCSCLIKGDAYSRTKLHTQTHTHTTSTK
jgi:hypothetical protein